MSGPAEGMLQVLWPMWVLGRDRMSLTTRDVEVYNNDPDAAAPTPERMGIVMQGIRAAIDKLEQCIMDMAKDPASTHIDQLVAPLANMSRGAQRRRIRSYIDERGTRQVEMDNKFDLDLDHPSLFPPPIEYYRLGAEINLLEDHFTDVDYIDGRPRDARPNEIAPATAFLEGLPVVAINELAEDGGCAICMEPYVTGCGSDVVRLPCGHLFGSQCLSTWLSTEADTCPMCRAVLFEVPPDLYYTSSVLDLDDNPRPTLHPMRLAGGRDPVDFLDYLVDINILLKEQREQHPDQPMLILDTTWGPVEARGFRRAGRPRPEEQSFAEVVLKISKRFFTAGEPDEEIATALAALMGKLYESLREAIQIAGCPIVWAENGPPPSSLIDPAGIPLVEAALERLVQVESWNL